MNRKTARRTENIYSLEEENWNIGTHAFGLIISIIGVIILFFNAWQLQSIKVFIAFLIYGIGVITMFLASTLYHSSKDPIIRSRLNVFDHSAIYLTIAGSYTPISLLTLPSLWGIPILIAVWTIAAAGIILKFFYIGRFPRMSTIMYVLMGWVIVVAIKPLITNMETNGLIWLLAGGLAYSIGAILYQSKKLKFNHAIFHFFVLIGAVCHYIVIYRYCIK
jgi:hemolysin III